MFEYLILDQPDSKIVRDAAQIIQDNDLWDRYLRDICLLRGKVYINEGLYTGEILTQDGQFKEEWDTNSVHFAVLDNGKVVGSVRLTFLQQGETIRSAEISNFLKKFNLQKHANTFNYLLSDLSKRGRKVIEASRLIVEEEYRRFKNIHSQVSLVLFTMIYSYAMENGVNDGFIIQGNKYRTSDIYERMGFRIARDIETNITLEPFFDADDICQLMHLEYECVTQLYLRYIKKFKPIYDKAKIIKRVV